MKKHHIIPEKIEYISKTGYRGILYDWHKSPEKESYQMSIQGPDGKEILHSYHASPKNLEELKEVVNQYAYRPPDSLTMEEKEKKRC